MMIKRKYLMLVFVVAVSFSCGKKKSAIREHINKLESGYIQEIKTDQYSIQIQYQPPSYRADQEIMLNDSKMSRSDLMEEYDQLQQFLVKYKLEDPNATVQELGMMDKFSLVVSDTIPCIDAHSIPYSPGAPDHEVLLLFPVSEKELGDEFVLAINDFPIGSDMHQIRYQLNKKD
jgi:hypothetical protein